VTPQGEPVATTPRLPLTFAFPALNEAENVGRLLTEIAALSSRLDRPFQVVVLNDGSTDQTREVVLTHEIARSGHVTVLDQPRRMGVARAFERIFRHAGTLAPPWRAGHLVTLEGDNTSDLSILPEMIRHLEELGSDVALASCYAPGGRVLHTTFIRKALSAGANLFVKALFFVFGIGRIHTFSSFYRAYRLPTILPIVEHYGDAWIGAVGFECMVEMIVKLRARGAQVTEVPMVLDGSQRKGTSKLRIARTICGYLQLAIYLMLPRRTVVLVKRLRYRGSSATGNGAR
jgi:dolichol-phosphate mannosyltransferase